MRLRGGINNAAAGLNQGAISLNTWRCTERMAKGGQNGRRIPGGLRCACCA